MAPRSLKILTVEHFVSDLKVISSKLSEEVAEQHHQDERTTDGSRWWQSQAMIHIKKHEVCSSSDTFFNGTWNLAMSSKFSSSKIQDGNSQQLHAQRSCEHWMLCWPSD